MTLLQFDSWKKMSHHNESLINKTFHGKTYTLIRYENGSTGYFNEVKDLISNIILKNPDLIFLLSEVRKSSKSYNKFNDFSGKYGVEKLIVELSKYTLNTKEHLNSLTLTKKHNKTLGAKEFQYHCFMLEIELLNKININKFKQADYKIALLPHCLHDLSRKCSSTVSGIDYQCMSCSGKCFINKVNEILNSKGIVTFIWKTLKLKTILKQSIKKYGSVAVMGIACLPELTFGMRRCFDYGIPVIGLPLDGNRCRRWFGEFYDNSVNLEELKRMLDN